MRMVASSRKYYYLLELVGLFGRGLSLKLHNMVSRASLPLICLALSKSLNNLFWKQFSWWQMGMAIPTMTTWQRWYKDTIRWKLWKCFVKVKMLHRCELLLMKISLKKSDHLPNLHFSRVKNAFLDYMCTLFHRLFLIITLKDFIRAVTVNFIPVCCTRSAFKILIDPSFWLKTAGRAYNPFFHIRKAHTKACQEVTHFVKRCLPGLKDGYYFISGRNYV